MIDVSIIIVNYNTKKLAEDAIDSVFRKTEGVLYEVILVDNASSDGSRDCFAGEKYRDRIVFLASDNNLGFGKANNLGISVARGKYVFFLNPDTSLVNNAVKILYDFMEKECLAGICGANLYDENMQPTHSFNRSIPGKFYDIEEFFKNLGKKIRIRTDFNFSGRPLPVGYITGADMFVRKSLLDELGGFDPDFFIYYEEAELTYRISRAGYKAFSVPDARIIHLEGKSFVFKETRFRLQCESKYKFFKKLYGNRYALLAYWFSQCKYLLIPCRENMKKFKINREEYKKCCR